MFHESVSRAQSEKIEQFLSFHEYTKKTEENYKTPNFRIDFMERTESGKVLMLMEDYHWEEYTEGNPASQVVTRQYAVIRGYILAVQFAESGAINWITLVPKSQIERTPYLSLTFLSYSAVRKGADLLIAYLDEKENLGTFPNIEKPWGIRKPNFVGVTIDDLGGMDYKVINEGYEIKDYTIRPSFYYNYNGEYLLYFPHTRAPDHFLILPVGER